MTHRRTMLRAMGLGGLAIAGANLAACTNPDNGNGGSDPETGPVELRVAVFTANEGHLGVLNSIGEAYVAAHPERVTNVVFESLPGGSYVTALQTQIAGGQSPDLAWMFEANARQFVDGGAFVDVTDTLRNDPDYHLDDVVAEALKVWQQGDRIFAYPFSNSPFGVYVNLDLLNELDQANPRDLLGAGTWTWEELVRGAAAVADSADGRTGFQPGVDPFAGWLDGLGTMWPQWGAQPWSDDGSTCQLTSDGMTTFFSWFHDQIHKTHAHAGPGETYDFASGQVGYKLGLLSGAKAVDAAGFEWDFLPLPAGPAGVHPIVGQAAIGVLSQSKKIEVASHFLAFSTNQASGAKLAEFFPQPRHSLLTEESLKQVSPLLSDEMITGTIIEQAKRGTTKQGHKNLSRITDKVKVHLDAYWPDPTADIDDLMARACADIQGDLA